MERLGEGLLCAGALERIAGELLGEDRCVFSCEVGLEAGEGMLRLVP